MSGGGGGPRPERRGWKGFWRNLETSGPVRRVKRRVRQWLGTEIRSRVEVRCRTAHHGGWWVARERLRPGGLAYCFGVGEDLDLERVLAERYGMDVVAFDPTPSTVEWVRGQQLPPNLRYVPLGVAGHDGTALFLEPEERSGCHSMVPRPGQTGDAVEVEVRRLSTILAERGDARLDLLKLDIEGAEYDVLEDLLSAGVPVAQLLVEFHHRFPAVGNRRTEEALRRLHGAGYRICHIAPSGREYAFVREAGAGSGRGDRGSVEA